MFPRAEKVQVLASIDIDDLEGVSTDEDLTRV
jgi:hypothetical protein